MLFDVWLILPPTRKLCEERLRSLVHLLGRRPRPKPARKFAGPAFERGRIVRLPETPRRRHRAGARLRSAQTRVGPDIPRLTKAEIRQQVGRNVLRPEAPSPFLRRSTGLCGVDRLRRHGGRFGSRRVWDAGGRRGGRKMQAFVELGGEGMEELLSNIVSTRLGSSGRKKQDRTSANVGSDAEEAPPEAFRARRRARRRCCSRSRPLQRVRRASVSCS